MVITIEPRGVVRVNGPDAAKYLQGQLSQDIDAIGEDALPVNAVPDEEMDGG